MTYHVGAYERLSLEEYRNLGDTSGLIVEEKEGVLSLGFIDYFGDRDYECFFCFKSEDAEKFKAELNKLYQGDLFDQCVQAFTIKCSVPKLDEFCKKIGVAYERKSY